MTTSATVRLSAVLLPCPACQTPMLILGDTAQCCSDDCEHSGKQFKLELPKFDVTLEEPVA